MHKPMNIRLLLDAREDRTPTLPTPTHTPIYAVVHTTTRQPLPTDAWFDVRR